VYKTSQPLAHLNFAQEYIAAIILNPGLQKQLETLWNAVENLVDLHATKMVHQLLPPAHRAA
jgi:hypothetical protein